jgi:hypothetical protein
MIGTTFGAPTAALAVSIAAVLLFPVGLLHAGGDLFAPALIPMALLVASNFARPLRAFAHAARNYAVFKSLEPALAVLSGRIIPHGTFSGRHIGGHHGGCGAASPSADQERHPQATPADAPQPETATGTAAGRGPGSGNQVTRLRLR